MRGAPVSLFDAFGLFSLLFAQMDLHGDMMWSELGRIQFCTTWPCRLEPMILLLSTNGVRHVCRSGMRIRVNYPSLYLLIEATYKSSQF